LRIVDVEHLGRKRAIGCWLVDGFIIDPGPQVCEETLVAGLGDVVPTAIVLTHIHLDHAAATGSLVRRWPGTPVFVHERGAKHVVDPSRLLASASQLYPDMDTRWGSILPVPAEQVHPIADGDRILDSLRVRYTPGHASHHVCFLHEATGTAFVGDMVGVRVAPSAYTLMPTPPPDIDVEAWLASIDAIEDWAPTALALTHFDRFEDVEKQCERARGELRRWAEASRGADADAYLARVEADLADGIEDRALREVYRQACPPDVQFGGLARYWRKREAAARA
jgi:glyoxylase-like metal-dependent hydrolase (beta-lactamase superfamily II)